MGLEVTWSPEAAEDLELIAEYMNRTLTKCPETVGRYKFGSGHDQRTQTGVNTRAAQCRGIVLLGLLLWLACLPAAGWAEDSQQTARRLQAAGDILPLRQLLDKVRQQVSGHILELELVQRRQGLVYELEIIDDQGVIWDYRLDARSGRILQRKREED